MVLMGESPVQSRGVAEAASRASLSWLASGAGVDGGLGELEPSQPSQSWEGENPTEKK